MYCKLEQGIYDDMYLFFQWDLIDEKLPFIKKIMQLPSNEIRIVEIDGNKCYAWEAKNIIFEEYQILHIEKAK